MIYWEKEQRDVFVNTALTKFLWVPCAFIVLIAEETGANPYSIAKVSWIHVNFDTNQMRIGKSLYTLSDRVFDLLRQQKERLTFQTYTFPVFRKSTLRWTPMSRKEMAAEFDKVKRKAGLPMALTPDTLRISIFRERVNSGQLPTSVYKDMRMSLEEFETYWRKVTRV